MTRRMKRGPRTTRLLVSRSAMMRASLVKTLATTTTYCIASRAMPTRTRQMTERKTPY